MMRKQRKERQACITKGKKDVYSINQKPMLVPYNRFLNYYFVCFLSVNPLSCRLNNAKDAYARDKVVKTTIYYHCLSLIYIVRPTFRNNDNSTVERF